MTHEELLELMDEYEHWDSWKFYDALRAVVELHKPETFHNGTEDVTVCHECNYEYSSEIDNKYPCKTIRTIKEQL
jgi:hypothetical protein